MEKAKIGKYKWVIAVVCFFMVMITLGFCSSPRGLFQNTLLKEFDVASVMYAPSNSIRYITTAIVNIFFGFLIAKLGPKKLIVAGLSSLIIYSLLSGFAVNIYMIWAASVFLGIGLSWTTTTMVGYVVGIWCKENKGTIMGAILASNGIGGAISRPMAAAFIKSGNWRVSHMVVASILATLLAVVLIFFKSKPKNIEIAAPASGHGKKKPKGQDWVGISFGEALRKPYFWSILVCIFFSGFILQGIGNVMDPHLEMRLGGPDLVAIIGIVHSITLVTAKFLTGFLYDKIGLRFTATFCMALSATSVWILPFVYNTTSGIVLAFIYGAICSFALPLETVMLPIYASDLFGEKSYGKVLGLFVSVNTAGYALGSPAFELCRTITGEYTTAFFIASASMLVVLIILQFTVSAAHKVQKRVIAEHEAALEAEAAAALASESRG